VVCNDYRDVVFFDKVRKRNSARRLSRIGASLVPRPASMPHLGDRWAEAVSSSVGAAKQRWYSDDDSKKIIRRNII